MKTLCAAALCLLLSWGGRAWAGSGAGVPAGEGSTRLIIGFRPGTSAGRKARWLREAGLKAVGVLDDSAASDRIDALLAEPPAGLFRLNVLKLKADPNVLHVERDFYVNWIEGRSAAPSQVPMPSLAEIMAQLPKLVPVPDAQGEIPWGVSKVRAPEAWKKGDWTAQGVGVRVAVIDSGVDCGHRDLGCDYADGYNAVDPSQTANDENGHGTHVAGTIAAKWDGSGVVGVAPRARVIPVKVLDKNGGGNLSSVVKGILWCARNNIQVANMSLGSPEGSVFMHWAVMYARSKGVTVVAAAGNHGMESGSVSYPGAYDQVVTVSASDHKDALAPFSSRGPAVDFIAPGVSVLSTVPGGHAKYSGTSMAAPHVSGLAALTLAQGTVGPDAVRAALRRAARPLPGLSAEQQGAGLIDAEALVRGR